MRSLTPEQAQESGQLQRALRAVFLEGAPYLKAARLSGLHACATDADASAREQIAAARAALAQHDPGGGIIRIYCDREAQV